MTATCAQCGRDCEGMEFCPACGAYVGWASKPPESQNQSELDRRHEQYKLLLETVTTAVRDAETRGDLLAAKSLGRDRETFARLLSEVDAQRQPVQASQTAGDLVPMLVDISTSVGAAGIFELSKAGLKRWRARWKSRNKREYSEEELIEHTQRALSGRLSLPFAELDLLSIEFTPDGDAIAAFITASSDKYRVTIKMAGGVAVIIRLQHEVRR